MKKGNPAFHNHLFLSIFTALKQVRTLHEKYIV